MHDSLSGMTLPIIAILFFVCVAIFFKMQHTKRNHSRAKQQVKDEETSRKKEKYSLALAFADELSENRLKCETFITIYTELLRDLRDLDRRASYEETGDFIHRHPSLDRTLFEENKEKIDILGTSLSHNIQEIYQHIFFEPEYITLEAGLPRVQALLLVEKVLDDAQKIINPIDPVMAGLNIIIRDGERNT